MDPWPEHEVGHKQEHRNRQKRQREEWQQAQKQARDIEGVHNPLFVAIHVHKRDDGFPNAPIANEEDGVEERLDVGECICLPFLIV